MYHQILRSHHVERRNKHKHWLKRRQFCQCCLSLRNSARFLSMSGKLLVVHALSVLQCAFSFFSPEIWLLNIAHTCIFAPERSRSSCKRLCHPVIQLCIVGIAKRAASAAYLVPFPIRCNGQSGDRATSFFFLSATPCHGDETTEVMQKTCRRRCGWTWKDKIRFD